MDTFKTIDQNDKEQFINTHYYKWLKNKKPKDIHNIDSKVEYLSEQGFVKGTDKLTAKDLTRLQYIEEFYFRTEILTSC